MRRRIVPRRDLPGGCFVRLTAPERALLAQLPKELGEVLAAVAAVGEVHSAETGESELSLSGETPESAAFPPAEGVPVVPPSLRRLFPPAYTGDDDAERSFVAVSRAELLDHHRGALQILSDTASAKSLDEEQLQGWLTALNDVRLVLGTVLDISEETEGPEHPISQQMAVYYYLSGLQAELVEFLSNSLPDPVPGADDQIPDDPWGEPLGGLRWDGTQQPGDGP
jgi:hypothetical protein